MSDYYVDYEGNITTKKKKKKQADYYVGYDGKVTKAEDIAPVKETAKKSNKRTWFQKGGLSALDDGFQLSDVDDIYKTVTGTARDITENLYAGITGIAENTIDAGAYAAGAVGGLLGADDFQSKMQKFIAKDIINEEKVGSVLVDINGGGLNKVLNKILGIKTDTESDSVLGEKSDALVQSGGQLVGTIGLQAVGVPWFVTTGVTSFGGAAEEAFNEGASYGEAGLSAAITAGADILTEKLFGGSGLGEKGLINLDGLTKGITKKAIKVLADWGIDLASEGGEEVIASFISKLGNQLTTEKEETWEELLTNEEAMDNYISQVGNALFGKEARAEYGEAFIGGAVLGGGMNAGKAVSSVKTGTDYRTGLTENEQKVFDKAYNDALAEAEKGGKRLNQKEKAKIYDEVSEDMKKGYISTDTIEEILGDESSKIKPDSLLAESYREKARRRKAFEADLSQYNEKQQKTVKNAIESGILNNTNRTHEFVDTIAKISADKGIDFNFTNNAKLKETGFALNGKTVNGYITKDGISLNMDSAGAWRSTVGHEITHALEGTELYDTLSETITQYAKNKGEYETRRKALEELYKNVKNANVDSELVADLVGDYLFTDKDFIRKLSTENRNVFEKIYDEIKYLCKIATAGSKEARQLEKVKKTFAEVYRESGKVNATKNSGTKLSIFKTQDMNWNEQINGLLENKGQINRSDTLVVEKNTPTFLQSDVIEDLPLAVPLSVITKATKGKDLSHSIKPEKLKDLQKGIRNAEIIIKNPERNSFVFITDVKQDGYPVLVSFLQNTEFDGDRVHKATSIHLQIDVNSMLEALPETSTVYYKNKKEFNSAVGVTNNLRSLAAKVEFIDEIVPQTDSNVNRQYPHPTDSTVNRKSEKSPKRNIADMLNGKTAEQTSKTTVGIVPDNSIPEIAPAVNINSAQNASDYTDSELYRKSVKAHKSTADKGGVMFSLNSYSEHQLENWKNSKKIVVYENESQLRSFINEALGDEHLNKKMYFGSVPSKLAAAIKSSTGLDVEGYNCSLSAYEIRKIFKDHANKKTESQRGQRAITEDDIVNIPVVIQSPESISLSEKSYMGKPVIVMSKNINGKMTVAAVVSDKHLDLFVQTAYVGIKKGNLVTPIAEQAAINTPKASSDTVSDNSIPEIAPTVNNNSMPESSNNSETEKNKIKRAYSLAKSQDSQLIAKAEEYELENKSRDYIFKETGLVRDPKGIWLYELDDSKMKFYPNGDVRKKDDPDYHEYLKYDKMINSYPEFDTDENGDLILTEEQEKVYDRYCDLIEILERRYGVGEKLKDYVVYDELFEKYPQTAEADFVVADLSSSDAFAYYNSEKNEIVLDKRLYNGEYEGRRVESSIIHEIQHALQTFDERQNGSSTEFWNIRLKKDGHLPYSKKVGRELTPDEAYWLTAGEIEAREAAARRELPRLLRRAIVPGREWEYALYPDEELAPIGKEGVKYSIRASEYTDSDYLFAIKTGDTEAAQKMVDAAAQKAGYTERLYHQTDAAFNEFNTDNQKAGKFDHELPTGIFLKPSDMDIGLSGKKQMELYAKLDNPLHFATRHAAAEYWKRNISGYSEVCREITGIDREYSARLAQAERETKLYISEWKSSHPEISSSELYKDTEFQRLYDSEDSITTEWESKANEASLKAKELISTFMADSKYDGIIVDLDRGSGGRFTKTYIAFNSSQLKSAAPVTYDDAGNVIALSDRFNAKKGDIRYSLSASEGIDTYTEEQYNNFGWVSDNNLVSAKEREILLSRYADYKHNRDKYPTTRFGEAVIHSSECPDVIMYIKGEIICPDVTKIVRINANHADIKEMILRNEREGYSQPFKAIEAAFGYGILNIDYKRDYESFRQVKARTERERSQAGNNNSGAVTDGAGSIQQNTATDRAGLNKSAFSIPDNDYSIAPEREKNASVDTYTEEQYNNFGWVSDNNLVSAKEREILLSRYADYKHNRDKYPTTRFGEAVIHSSECPDVIMYVKGEIGAPDITKVVRIDSTDSEDISFVRERIIKNEFEGVSLPFDAITNYCREGILIIDRKRDYESFRQVKARTERERSQAGNNNSGAVTDGAGSIQQNTATDRAGLNKSAFSIPDNDYSIAPEREKNASVDTYTEEQYNNFGWASYNGVITSAERETLLSRYADYKHNRDKYPTTRFGEAVIHSSECPDVIMYVKGSIRNPQITKVVRITEKNVFIKSEIKKELLKLEREQTISPSSFIESVFGEGIFRIDRLRNNESFQEYQRRKQGSSGAENNSFDRIEQNRGRGTEQNTATDRADLDKSAFSIPDNDYSIAPEREKNASVDTYTEEQYNNFGWASYNGVITSAERETLLSRYADYKHNRDKYPTTRFGEAVIHSSECPDVIMYVKGSIRNPQITKVVRINYFDTSEILEEILTNERRHLPLPYKSVESIYGEEILTISKARDYVSFREYKSELQGRNRQTGNSDSRIEQDRGRGAEQNTGTDRADLDKSAFSIPDNDYSIAPEREKNASVDTYTEEQYNNFGWASYNGVITSAERETLLSRYADYKHNRDKYPTTRFGEAVIHSSECPDVIMYVKGSIRNPQITKVVRIEHEESWAIPFIKEEILSNEYKQDLQPFKTIEDYFGYGVLNIAKARNYASYREYKSELQGRNRQTGNSVSRIEQDRGRGTEQNTATDRADLDKSAFSMPDYDFSVPVLERAENISENLDYTVQIDELNGRLQRGEISVDTFKSRLDELYSGAVQQYGAIPEGETFSIAYDSENSSVKEQLKENQNILNNMETAAHFESALKFDYNQEVVDWAVKQFETINFKVERDNFGKIIFDKKRIKKGLSYLKTLEEKLAFAMVPSVLQKGVEIGSHNRHKGRAYDTVTFAAPVILNGTRGNMAVVVRQEGKNYYKVHRLVMPDGSQFVFNKKRDSAETAGGVNNNSSLSPTDNVSNNRITHNSSTVNNNSTQKNNDYSIAPEREKNASVDTYTEEQYNNFGWASYNGVITSAERETLLSRYADYKHNRDKYPTTRFGEAVIHSFDYPDVFMYVKGTIKNPQITKIVRITETNSELVKTIRKEILKYEYEQVPLPYQNVQFIFGEEILNINRRRDCLSFQEYKREQERGFSKTDNSFDRIEQDRGRGTEQNTGTDRADLDKSTFSAPDYNYSLPYHAESLSENYKTHSGENLRNSPEALMPESDREWSVFNRSFANQTNGLKSGEKKSIIIHTAQAQYIVAADGYMSGMIVSKADINDYNERIDYIGNNRRTEVSNFRDGKNGYRKRNNSNSNNSFEGNRTDSFYVELDAFIRDHSEQLADIRQDHSDYKRRTEELKQNKADLEKSAFSAPDYNYSLPYQAESLSENYKTHSGENLRNSPEALMPESDREWSVFNRSFANQTNGLKSGEKKSIIITTSSSVYFVCADGYMSGIIADKMNIDKYLQRGTIYDNIGGSDFADRIDEILGDRQRNGKRNGIFENGRTNNQHDDLDAFIEEYPEFFANKRESYGDYKRGQAFYDSLGRTEADYSKNESLGYRQRNSGFGSDVFNNQDRNTAYDELDEFIDSHPEWFTNKRESYSDYKRRTEELKQSKADLDKSAFSLSVIGEHPIKHGRSNVPARDLRLESQEDIAPVMPEQKKDIAITAGGVNKSSGLSPTNNIFTNSIPQKLSDANAETGDISPVKTNDRNTIPRQRGWAETSTESETVNLRILPDDLNQSKINYQPISNKKTLNNANSKLNNMGYETAVAYFNSQFANRFVSLEDIALGERLIQEAVKKEDYKTAGELIENVAVLGTELGQKVQALSIIQRLTPEGQLKMLKKTVERGKTKGDKAFEGVNITQDMIDKILKLYEKDGTYNQQKLNQTVEDVKQQLADQMSVTNLEKLNAWRYLAMLGNPKTHIRNMVSNIAMKGTIAVKNTVAKTIEDIAPIKSRTKTWKKASDEVSRFAETTATEMKELISGSNKYSEFSGIKSKRNVFKNKVLKRVYEFNSDMLEKADWAFSKSAFKNSLQEFLTANGIETKSDIENNSEIIEKAKMYAAEQAQIATFRQYSWLANKINELERKNAVTDIAVGAVLPFRKTPINVAKTGLSYSPLGFAKTLTYDISEVKKGNMEASTLIDHLAQNVTGTALTLVGYMLASMGILNGGGDDDKEGTYDYQLGKQAYSITIGDNTFSLSWLSPVAMPLFVGANAYEQLVEGEEWNGDVVIQTLAETLDPLSEMSFLSSLDSVLSSYDSGIQKFAGIGEAMLQNYVTQFIPTLSSQAAATLDDTKRSTKVSGDSGFKFFDETINRLKYKIPFLRETLEPSTDIWGNEIKQTKSIIGRAVENFIAPYSRKERIATGIDEEIKRLYAETGNEGLIPSIPYNYVNYKGEKYKMSASEYTDYKKTYGQTAGELLEELFNTTTYKNATSEEKADMANDVYDYARDEAKFKYLAQKGVDYTNATKGGAEYYKESGIKGAIENDMNAEEYAFYTEYPEKYAVANSVGGYNAYRSYKNGLSGIKASEDSNGKIISGSRKEKVIDYINNLDADYGEKLILFRSEYPSDDTYNYEIVDYLNSREDLSYSEIETILKELGFTVLADGTVRW